MSNPQNGETTAIVEWLIGDRMMSTFMRNAGLGIQRVGVRQRNKITYKAGEVVDEARVLKAVNYMIEQLNAENSKMEISDPKVISINVTVL